MVFWAIVPVLVNVFDLPIRETNGAGVDVLEDDLEGS